MHKRLQIAVMAGIVAATSTLLASSARAFSEGDGSTAPITATDDHGRKVYVNDIPVAKQPQHAEEAAPRRNLMYWSSKENLWKPVPPPNAASMQAARSAAAEVNQYLGRDTVKSANAKITAANFRGPTNSSPVDVDTAIAEAAARHNVDPNLVRAVIKVESNFNPNAISRKGAMGLMQLMPSTARQLNVKNPFDPEQNVDAGVRHLKQLLENYGGDIKLTLAAYNAGAGAVARSSGVPRYAETQNYVRRITNLYYGGFGFDSGSSRNPMTIQRDARGFLYVSNTE
jgi:Transglycosylase SLT domain